MSYSLSGTNTITLDDYLTTSTSPSLSAGTYTVGALMSNGAGSATWASIGISDDLSGSSLQVKGDANFDGDVKVKGKSIVDSLERIEEKLAILRPNEELEEKWDNLRALRNAYMELEKEIIEKENVWKILKK